jgi:hypothetical protein
MGLWADLGRREISFQRLQLYGSESSLQSLVQKMSLIRKQILLLC